ncbi:MAG: hypothetical protein AAFR84_08340 [Pseudomonadota bacterium]
MTWFEMPHGRTQPDTGAVLGASRRSIRGETGRTAPVGIALGLAVAGLVHAGAYAMLFGTDWVDRDSFPSVAFAHSTFLEEPAKAPEAPPPTLIALNTTADTVSAPGVPLGLGHKAVMLFGLVVAGDAEPGPEPSVQAAPMPPRRYDDTFDDAHYMPSDRTPRTGNETGRLERTAWRPVIIAFASTGSADLDGHAAGLPETSHFPGLLSRAYVAEAPGGAALVVPGAPASRPQSLQPPASLAASPRTIASATTVPRAPVTPLSATRRSSESLLARERHGVRFLRTKGGLSPLRIGGTAPTMPAQLADAPDLAPNG